MDPADSWTYLAAWLVGLLTFYTAAYLYSTRKVHPQEPPVVASAVPFLGHLYNMVFGGAQYVKRLGRRNRDKPIFTLVVPGSRMYMVTDPGLASLVQRATKTLSFNVMVPNITERMLGLDAETVEMANQNLDPAPGGEKGFIPAMHDSLHTWLAEYLDDMSLAATTAMRDELAAFARTDIISTGNNKAGVEQSGSGAVVDLMPWFREFVGFATGKFLYGPENPLAVDPGLTESYWDWDTGLGGLFLGLFPKVTASKAFYGREKLVAAFADYLGAEKHKGKGVARLVQRRVDLAHQYGWSLDAAARAELSFLFAGISNTAYVSFWTVLRIFADRDLLAVLRREVEAVLVPRQPEEGQDGGGGGGVTIPVLALRENCPMLRATYHESLRLASVHTSVRFVKEDTVIGDKYFFKKGSVVQICGGIMHEDRSIWGDDVDEFNPRRFLGFAPSSSGGTSSSSSSSSSSKPATTQRHPAAFRAFGGGNTVCPGRHFATNENLAIIALLVLFFEMEAAAPSPSPSCSSSSSSTAAAAASGSTCQNGSSSSNSNKNKKSAAIYVPPVNDTHFTTHLLDPQTPVHVRISMREKEGVSPADLLSQLEQVQFSMDKVEKRRNVDYEDYKT